jgi:hypothetical protein
MPMSLRILTLLAAFALSAEAGLAAPAPFEADYSVSRNGKSLGDMRSRLTRAGDEALVYRSVTEGRNGLAGLLGVRIEEESHLTVDAAGLSSSAYRYRQEMVARKRERTLRIEPDGRVTETDNDRKWEYKSTGGALDRHAVVLAIAARLREGLGDGVIFDVPVADKGSVEPWRFLVAGHERIDTGNGPADTIRIERVRKDSGRRTVSWHAPEMDYLPVKVEQVEPDGEVLTSVLQRYEKR